MRWFTRRSMLEDPLFRWPSGDFFMVRDLLRSGCIFGATGSGKSSGSGLHFARAAVNYPNSSGLILASKPEELQFWRTIFVKAGRAADLLVFGPNEPHRFNFFDGLGGDTLALTHTLLTISESLRGGKPGGGGEDAMFWRQQTERIIYNSITILRQAGRQVTAPNLLRFISTAATSPALLNEDSWKAGYHSQTFALAHVSPKTPIEIYDYELAKDYFLSEWPSMPDRLRGSILASVMGLLHVLNSGIVRELVSTDTTISPAVMDQRKWVLVNMPTHQYGESARLIMAGWKYLTQRYILRRHAGPDTPVTVLWADECQNVVNSFDSEFLAECRSHRGCMVYLTQSIHSYFSTMSGEAGRAAAEALLTNFGTKVFHALGDDQTAQYAASLIGKSLQTYIGGSMPAADSLYDELVGHSKFNGSFSQHVEQVLQNNAFMSGLRTGGRANRLTVDGIVIKSGEPFSHGENWQRVEFSQA